MSQDDEAPGLTYGAAGVDIDAGDELVERIKPHVRRTMRPEVLTGLGGFAGLCALPKSYRDPVLVACTDGVGTKLKLAFMTGRHDTVGVDLVAMNVNDMVVSGAEPLFFLDYFAAGKLDVGVAETVIAGIAEGCRQAGCALIGGETAELPGFYQPGEYDLAGFCVGVVEKFKIVDGSTVRPGDVVLGLAASGLHSNGYSLARKVAFDVTGLDVDSHVPELGRTVGEELLEPTRIYARALKDVLANYRVKRAVRGIAHITGGGLVENVPRVLPDGCQVAIYRGSWPVPPVFGWLARLGQIDDAEMFRVFNMGIGMVLIVGPFYADHIQEQLSRRGVASHVIGEVRAGAREVVLVDGSRNCSEQPNDLPGKPAGFSGRARA
jgi:phosphoribosylformylglycinamidine cyclo-ligase